VGGTQERRAFAPDFAIFDGILPDPLSSPVRRLFKDSMMIVAGNARELLDTIAHLSSRCPRNRDCLISQIFLCFQRPDLERNSFLQLGQLNRCNVFGLLLQIFWWFQRLPVCLYALPHCGQTNELLGVGGTERRAFAPDFAIAAGIIPDRQLPVRKNCLFQRCNGAEQHAPPHARIHMHGHAQLHHHRHHASSSPAAGAHPACRYNARQMARQLEEY